MFYKYIISVHDLPFQFLNNTFQTAKILHFHVVRFIILNGFLFCMCVCIQCLDRFRVKARIS